MIELDELFSSLHGKKPTPEDIQRIRSFCEVVGADENDAFSKLVVALDYYHGIFSEVPHRINESVKTTVSAAMSAAKSQIDALTNSAVSTATAAVEESMKHTARRATIRTLVKSIGVGSLSVALTLCATGYYFRSQGLEEGRNIGRAEQRDEELYLKLADSWAHTDEGLRAYEFSKGGGLKMILECSAEGWQLTDDGFCFPKSVPGKGLRGWHLKKPPIKTKR